MNRRLTRTGGVPIESRPTGASAGQRRLAWVIAGVSPHIAANEERGPVLAFRGQEAKAGNRRDDRGGGKHARRRGAVSSSREPDAGGRSRAHGLAANTSLALVGDVVAKAGMFVALLLLAHSLAVVEFSRLGVAMAAMLIVTSVLDGGISVVATREGAADPMQRLGLLRASATARMPLAAAAAAGCLVAGAVADQLQLAAVVLVAALVNAAQLALFAVFRSAQTLVNEAVAKGLCGVSYPLFSAAAIASGHRSACVALLAMAAGPLATVPPLLLLAHRLTTGHSSGIVRARTLLRRSAPFGLIALATLVYYRAPMLMMGLLATHAQTGAYAVAANIAFGLLMLPSAFTVGLLPRLAGETDVARRAQLLRHALGWSTGILAAVELVLAASAWWFVPALYGHTYQGAVEPLLILFLSGLAIGAAGIFGTALIATDHKREVLTQVAVALAVNVAASAVLIPRLEANGAALATLVTEVVSLGILAAAYTRKDRPLIRTATPPRPARGTALVP